MKISRISSAEPITDPGVPCTPLRTRLVLALLKVLRPVWAHGTAAAAACLAAALPHAAWAGPATLTDRTPQYHAPVVRESSEYYDVQGKTVAEVRSALRLMRSRAPLPVGNSYDASTRWDVQWRYDLERSDGSCSVKDFQATVDIAFRYPRLVRESAPAEVLAAWDRYMENLVHHETLHRDLAVAAAADLSRASSALPPAVTCEELDYAIHALGQAFMKKLYLDETAYDRLTGHGATQGAALP